MKKIYLGDAVYATFPQDRDGVWLTTEDGYRSTNEIFLEPEVYAALVAAVEARKNER